MLEESHRQSQTSKDVLQEQNIPLDRTTTSQVVALAGVSIESQAERIGGWHGTSLEAIEHALRRGAIAPSAIAHAKAAPGHLFFFPATPVDFNPHTDLTLQLHGRGGAIGYAEGSAAYHFIIKRFGLDFAKYEDHRVAMDVLDGILYAPRSKYTRATLSELGIAAGQERLFIEEVKSRKGFLIAIARSTFEQWKPSEGDQPGIDEKIFVPAGLPFDALAAIQPLGAVEHAFIERLRESL